MWSTHSKARRTDEEELYPAAAPQQHNEESWTHLRDAADIVRLTFTARLWSYIVAIGSGSRLQGPEVIPLKITFSTLKSTTHSVVTTPLSMSNTNTSCRSTETGYTIYCKVTLILSEALPLQISEQCNLHLPVFLVANVLISGFGALTDAIQRLAQAQRECHCHGCTYHPSVGLEDKEVCRSTSPFNEHHTREKALRLV